MRKENDVNVFDSLIAEAPKIAVLSDNPISLGEMNKDTFHLSYHLGPIYDIIRHEDTQMPLTIGVYGKWGCGKTTAMRWLDDALRLWNKSAESKNKITTRNSWFYPWKYHDKEEVWKGLISEVILNAIDFKNAESKTVLKAVKLLSSFIGKSAFDIVSACEFEVPGFKINGDIAKQIKDNFNTVNHPEKSYLNEYERELDQWIKDILSNNKRMVIFIDDLDRCMPDIALQVLEAIKLYLKIEKIIFVIGMDRNIVEKAVKAYCEEKHIDVDDDYGRKYLEKMFQVELQMSPSQREMDLYLDAQLETVHFKKCIDRKSKKGKSSYELFKHLIAKYGGRNPREVKRLINNSLIRGAGADKIRINSKKLTFEQGVQLYFIQKILIERYNRFEVVGDGDIGDGFFTKWSTIVRENNQKNGFFRILSKTTIERYMPDKREKETDTVSRNSEKLADYLVDTYSQYYSTILQSEEYSDLLILLSDEDLGDLMQIEYSAEIAVFAKEQQLEVPVADDDKIINAVIAEKLGKDPQDLTEKDYEVISDLDLAGKKISDIKRLKKCVNLKILDMEGAGISDISPLSQLLQLERLNLNNNQIKDISSLRDMVNLTVLSLYDNNIDDISPLRNLTQLMSLYLSKNQVQDISPLENLVNLTELSLYGNKIDDITSLKGLTNLVDLYLFDNQIKNISALEAITHLKSLLLNQNHISDVFSLEKLVTLKTLHLENNQIKNISPLAKLVNLTELNLSDNQISNISSLKDMKNLGGLHLSKNPVQNIHLLCELTNLNALDLSETMVEDLAPLAMLSNLSRLCIRRTQINNLEPIKILVNLKSVFLEGCTNITDEQIRDLQKTLPNCEIQAFIKEVTLLNRKYRLFFNPKIKGKSKIMQFGANGVILEGKNKNESSWQIRNGFLELLNSDGQVHSRFYFIPKDNRFNHTNDADTHSIRGQYIVLEEN